MLGCMILLNYWHAYNEHLQRKNIENTILLKTQFQQLDLVL
jgi:hypothetical protein